jgi:hypothetical protein
MRERSRSQRSSKSLQTKGVADLLLAMSNSITFVLTPISQRGRAAQPSKSSKPKSRRGESPPCFERQGFRLGGRR